MHCQIKFHCDTTGVCSLSHLRWNYISSDNYTICWTKITSNSHLLIKTETSPSLDKTPDAEQELNKEHNPSQNDSEHPDHPYSPSNTLIQQQLCPPSMLKYTTQPSSPPGILFWFGVWEVLYVFQIWLGEAQTLPLLKWESLGEHKQLLYLVLVILFSGIYAYIINTST